MVASVQKLKIEYFSLKMLILARIGGKVTMFRSY